jgi:inosine-uridine nucleoside N-ribohydrolase
MDEKLQKLLIEFSKLFLIIIVINLQGLTMINAQPVSLIIDTDVGNDIDDALAIALSHTLQSFGECNIVGITICNDDFYSAVYTSVLNAFYGRPDIPIGLVNKGIKDKDGKYLRHISDLTDKNGNLVFPRKISNQNPPADSIKLLRKILSSQPDKSVVIVMIGFSTNMARLLQTDSDEFSSLSGIELFRKKVNFVSAMAGDFSEEVQKNPTMKTREYNIRHDIGSAKYFFENCPVEVIFNGFEIGNKMLYPYKSIEQDYNWVQVHPVAQAYKIFTGKPCDRATWDLLSVLYAVRPEDGYLTLSEKGTAKVTDEGFLIFGKDSKGLHRYLRADDVQKKKILSLFVQLCPWQNCKSVPKSGKIIGIGKESKSKIVKSAALE